ncbi:MAG: maltotransferase domain-containing protein [Acidimicrobiia bacterium]
MLGRLIIDDVRPRTPAGYPAKAGVGEVVTVSATVFREGHDLLAARLRWRRGGDKDWATVPMALAVAGLDRWEAVIEPAVVGAHEFQVEAWTDRYRTWRHDIELKAADDPHDPLATDVEEGALLIERLAKRAPKEARPALAAAVAGLRNGEASRDARLNAGLDDRVGALLAPVEDPVDLTRSARFPLWVDRRAGRFSAWYELFPRSEGGLAGASKRLRAVAEMGFDVVYLPPVHPIGHTARKGPGNTLEAGPGDPGSPWAIGSEDGGHTAVHSKLGTLEDFDAFVEEAEGLGLEVALDYALQCSPDHPWVTEHPEWFHQRPDGTVKYAENPPKKYQDIYPINFWPQEDGQRQALWDACKDVLDHWIAHGVGIFRVDNPHTKPLAFWEWVIAAVRAEHPGTVFLAEAFTRPPMMAKLAEVGFTQGYTYFTWRTARAELEEYVEELAQPPLADFMRPSFWPNTPDILSGPLRNGPLAAFQLRYLLAALLAPNYGLYSGYELYENEPASAANEEYLDSEKYEVKNRDWDRADSMAPLITTVNDIRRRHPAFRELRTTRFHETGNDAVVAFSKTDGHGADAMLCVVTLDPHNPAEAVLSLDLPALGLEWDSTYEVVDELDGTAYTWTGDHPYVRLDPFHRVAHVLSVRPRSR